MKKFTSILFLSLLPYLVVSMSPQEKAPLIHHMEEINIEWANKGYDDRYNYPGSFINDNERIQKHLELVEYHLRNETHRFSQSQLENRNVLLDVLNGYHKRGQFPKNTFHSERIPYFIDVYGTACAVGYLMIESGYEALAEKIRSEGNYRYIREIDYPEVVEWAEKHGFTLKELAWIQPGYGGGAVPLPLGEGVDGEVNHLSIITSNPLQLLITGEFTQAGNIDCKTIAIWNGENYECPLENLTGEVNHVQSGNNRAVISGQFLYNDVAYNVLEIDNGEWKYRNILPQYSATITAFMSNLSFEFASGYYVEETDTTFFIAHRRNQSGSNWEIIAELNGRVNEISSSFTKIYFAGDFTTLNSDTFNYIALYDLKTFNSTSGTFHNLGTGLDSPVRVLRNYNEIPYVGGIIVSKDNERKFGLARFYNNQWQQLIGESNFISLGEEAYVNDFIFQNNLIYLVGKFEVVDLMFIPGRNIAQLDVFTGNLLEYGSVNDDINSIIGVMFGDQLFVGGKFSHDGTPLAQGHTQLNHIAQVVSIVGIEEKKNSNFKIYPNPAVDRITIELENHYQNLQLSLFFMDGRQVEPDYQTTSNEIILNRQHLPDGIYQIKVFEENEMIGSSRVVFTGK